jgi:hypothetical protein
MIFLKRWFAYNKHTQGEMHEYKEKAIAQFLCSEEQAKDPSLIFSRREDSN